MRLLKLGLKVSVAEASSHSTFSYRILCNAAADLRDTLAPNQEAPGALMSTWMGAFGKSIVAPIIPRLCMMAFVYAQPFLIKQAIILAQLPKTETFDNWGYGLIGAFVIVYGGLAVRHIPLPSQTLSLADMEIFRLHLASTCGVSAELGQSFVVPSSASFIRSR